MAADMPDDKHVEQTLQQIQQAIAACIGEDWHTDPVSAYRDRLRGYLETARACGDIHDYRDQYLLDPDTAVLYVDLKLILSPADGMIRFRLGQPPADTIE